MNLLATIQQIVQNSMKSANLTDLVYGAVASVNPLSVELQTLKLTIPAEALELTHMVADHFVDMTVDHLTEENGLPALNLAHSHNVPGQYTETAEWDATHVHGDGVSATAQANPPTAHNHWREPIETDVSGATGAFDSALHTHPYKGRKKFLAHYGLAVGEKVVMMKAHGGQKYLILSRVVSGDDYAGNP